MEEKALKNCNSIKAFLMILVILGHSCAFWSGHWFTGNPAIQSAGLGFVYSWVSSFHIYAFALVSGYLFAFKVLRGEYGKYLPFLKNKAKRLLIPYVFVMVIWVMPISAYFFHWDFGYLAKTFLFAIEPSQLWFLWMLFGVFAIVWPLKGILLGNPHIGWLIAIAFYGVGILGQRMLPNVFCIWTAFKYVPFFYIGMRIREKEEHDEKRITEWVPWYCWVGAQFFAFGLDMFVSRQNGMLWSMIEIGVTFTLNMLGAIMAWSTLQMIAGRMNWKEHRLFRTLSASSMPMYLFHQQIIYFVIYLLNGKVNPWINAGANFIISISGSYLISMILMHWKTTRILIGEK